MIDSILFQKFNQLLENKQNFLVIGHEKPDGDCVGSLLAFFEILKSLRKECRLVLRDPVPTVFAFLKNCDLIQNDFTLTDFDAVILLDNGDAKRTGFLEQMADCKKRGIPIVNIDHHPRNGLWKISSVNMVVESASSTCEIIYELARKLKIEINETLATSLLLGLYGDTGGFRHANTSKDVLTISSELLKRGAKLKKITQNISGTHSIPMLKLWGVALNRLNFNTKLGISYSILKHEDVVNANATDDEVSGLVNLLNSAPESNIALLLYETIDGKLRGSLRTESDDVDLSLLAQYLGGGGHKKAAGFTIEGKVEKEGDSWRIV